MLLFSVEFLRASFQRAVPSLKVSRAKVILAIFFPTGDDAISHCISHNGFSDGAWYAAGMELLASCVVFASSYSSWNLKVILHYASLLFAIGNAPIPSYGGCTVNAVSSFTQLLCGAVWTPGAIVHISHARLLPIIPPIPARQPVHSHPSSHTFPARLQFRSLRLNCQPSCNPPPSNAKFHQDPLDSHPTLFPQPGNPFRPP